MTAAIIGLGTAAPEYSIPQEEAAALAAELCAVGEAEARAVVALYRRSAVRQRGSVLLTNGLPDGGVQQTFFRPAADALNRGPSTAARLERYAAEATPLALSAARTALADAAMGAGAITHLVTVSCTGFAAPGLDVDLIRLLGLAPTVQRTHVGFMGCHGAINGLRVAAAIVNADPNARVLVCAVELCSLHFCYSAEPDRVVANALFGDGAAAAVVAPSHEAPRVAACGSCLFPDSTECMTWRIGDHGFEMTLSARVPGLIREHLPSWLRSFLDAHGVGVRDVAVWAVHPGGPRILSDVEAALGLSPEALAESRAVLAAHGNMSSPTVLFIIDRLRRSGRLPTPCVALAFGPGLIAEVCLIV